MTDAKLTQIIEQIEQAAAEVRDAQDVVKEHYATAKAEGYDTAILRKVIALRRKSADARAQEAALLDAYMAGLGMS